MKYHKYIAIDGDTWDKIAYQFYGNAFMYPILIKHNRSVPVHYQVPAGTTIYVPQIPSFNKSRTAPWLK